MNYLEIILIIIYSVLLLIGILFYRKYIKSVKNARIENNILEEIQYCRDIPYEYGPEILGYLINGENISTECLSASIMKLIRRKIFIIEEQSNGSFKIIDNDLENTQNMSDAERYLKQWMLNYLGDGKSFNSDALYISLSNIEEREDFNSRFKEWRRLVNLTACTEGFFSSVDLYKKNYLIFYMICFSIFMMQLDTYINNNIFVLSFKLIVLTYLSITAFLIFRVKDITIIRTTKGKKHYEQWMGLKKYLLDFSNFDEKKISDVYLWERYLVYAPILGVTDEINLRLDVNEVGISIDEKDRVSKIFHILDRKKTSIISDYKFSRKQL